ncbi:MAG TPA: nitrate- and nitrite sensing domain-containing protein, partial [Actinoplanes sp.]
MLFGKFRILGKLALLVLVPLLGVVALAVPIVANRVDMARDARDTADIVDLATEVGTALQELQEERLLSVGYFLGLIQRPELVVQSAKAKDRIARLKDLDQPLPPTLREAVEQAAGLDTTRSGILSRNVRPDLIVSQFTDTITPIIDGLSLGRAANLTTPAGRQVFALDQALRSDDMISQASSYLTEAVATGEPGFVGLFSSKLVELQLL